MKNCPIGGVEKRIEYMAKIKEYLTEAMNTISDSALSEPGVAVAVKAMVAAFSVAARAGRAGGGNVAVPQYRRANHEPCDRALQAEDLIESRYSTYIIVKLSEQSERQVKPCALISNIEETTDRALKSVIGNNKISFRVELPLNIKVYPSHWWV